MAPPTSTRRWRSHRSIRLIDAENIARTGRPTSAELAYARARLDAMAPPGPGDHTVVAADRANALLTGLTWPTAQLVVGHGRDGADIALLEWAASSDLVHRFDGLIVASGDFAFGSLAAEARTAGLAVTVVTWRDSCAHILVRIANAVLWLDPTAPMPAAAALEAPCAA